MLIFKRLVILMLMLSAVVLPMGVTQAASGPHFSLTATKSSPIMNDEFQVMVNGTDLVDLYGYEVNLTYDTTRLKFVKAENPKGGLSIEPKVYGQNIQIAHTLTGAIPGQNGNVILVTLTFKAIHTGSAEVGLSNLTLINSQSDEAAIINSSEKFTANIQDFTTPTEPSTPTPTPAPTPPATPSETTVKPTVILNKETNTVTATVDALTWTELVQKAKLDTSGNGKIMVNVVTIEEVSAYEQRIPSELISTKTKDYQIQLKTSVATISVPSNMFQGNILPDGEVAIHLAQVDPVILDEKVRKQIGNHPVIELRVIAGDKTIHWDNPKASVQVSLPYSPTTEELKNPEHIVIWYIDGNGNINSVSNGKYDASTGKVTFAITHFSNYAVAFVEKTFDDLSSFDWAKKQIEVLASKGIINGMSELQFAPAQQVSRADFIILLVRTLDLHGDLGSAFADVQEGAYYAEALRIARGKGITNGSGDNLFNPLEPITREDMMVLSERALKAANKWNIQAPQSELLEFKDRNFISDYATDSVANLVKSGLVSGYNNGIHPQATSTRAETAALMYNIYNY